MPDIMTTEQVDLRKSGTTDAIRAEELTARRNAFVNKGFSSEWISALEQQKPTLYSPLVLERHTQGLQERGFSNPNKMIESSPRILSLAFENIDAKLAGLQERGFSNPNKMIESMPAILGYTFENIDAKIAGLQERGFLVAIKLIGSSPAILGYTFENIDAKIAGLRERRFSKPTKMIESSPTILNLAFENIDAKIAGLRERRFSNPIKMIESLPPILNLTFENIDTKLAGLRERGFLVAIKLIGSSPAILGYTFENIDAKIAGLRERRFSKPTKMIESSPNILGYTFQNIDRKLYLFSKLIQLYQLPFSATVLMEQEPFLFSSKIDKMLVLVRILREYKVRAYELTDKVVKRLLRANLEDTLIALDNPSDPNEKIDDFIRRTRFVNKQRLPIEEKRRIIREGLLEFGKIKERYFRGYPDGVKE